MLNLPNRTRLIAATIALVAIALLTFGTAAATAVPTVATASQIAVGSGPWGMAVSNDGTRAYVANNNAGTMSVIDLTSNTVVATVNVGSGP